MLSEIRPRVYKWGSFNETAEDSEEAVKNITTKWERVKRWEQELPDMQKQFDTTVGQHLLNTDFDVRQGQTITLSHNHYKDKFHGALWATGGKRIFREAGTPCQVEVRVHAQILPYQESKWIESQLYKAVRAEHVKANEKLSQAQLHTAFGERMPKEPGDLASRGTTAVGKLIYVWNNVEVEVTPRRTRENPNEDMSHSWQAKLREATPTRALRKMRKKLDARRRKRPKGSTPRS